MTALYMDGFDHYGTAAASAINMQAGSYPYVNELSCSIPPWGAPRTGEYCLRNNGFAPSAAHFAVASPSTHYFVSFGFACDAVTNTLPYPVAFRTNSLDMVCYLNILPNGQIQVLDSTDTVVATSNGPVVKAENWHFFEMEIDSSAHTLTLRVDDAAGTGTPVISASGANIAGTIAIVSLLDSTSGGFGNIDDFFLRDASGSVNNGFLGDRRVATLLVNDDTSVAGWTPNFYQKLGAGILNNTVANSACYAYPGSPQNPGSGDYTLEAFVRFQGLPTGTNKAVLFGKWDETANERGYQVFLGSVSLNGGSLCLQTSTDGTVSTVEQPIVYPWTPNLNQWYHIAVVRASGEDLLFVDGSQLGLPQTDSRTYFASTGGLCLGGQVEVAGIVANTSLLGWMDEVRATIGYARYTTNFTPTTVEFPRDIGGDPEFGDVALLCGFDSLIQDESSFNWTMGTLGATQQTVHDGPAVGDWSTIGKAVPDDNTFISAPFVAATNILTIGVNPTATNTVTVGTSDGSTPATYTFVASVASAFDVLIDTNVQTTLQNLYNAINAGPGSGTKYGTGTTSNYDVVASQLPAGQMMVTAQIAGTAGNSIPSTESGLTGGGGWASTTLTGGLDIPGPSNFTVQRLPPTTTLVSAVQITMRSFKSDAGLGTINSALIGPLGGVGTGPTHALTISPSYYNDIYETDPDTSGPISPTTITNGSIEVNRDT